MAGEQSSDSVCLAGAMQAALHLRARTQMEARSVVQSLGALPPCVYLQASEQGDLLWGSAPYTGTGFHGRIISPNIKCHQTWR